MPTPILEITRDGELAIATLGRPPVNALDIESCEAIAAAFGTLGAEPGVKAVVLAGGAERRFAPGWS